MTLGQYGIFVCCAGGTERSTDNEVRESDYIRSLLLVLRCVFEMTAQFERFEQFGDAGPRVPTCNGQRGAHGLEQYQREVKELRNSIQE